MGLFDWFRSEPVAVQPADGQLVGHESHVIIGPPPKDYERAKAKLARLKQWVTEQDANGGQKVTPAHRKQIRILEAVLS